MATVEVMQTNEPIKPCHLHNDCTSTCQIQEQTPILPLTKAISYENQENVQKAKLLFNESQSMKQVRIRSLSHWKHSTPNKELMASAGWFACNVTDRVMCIYCNIICHEWTMYDDPMEVHARLAPQCPFVLSLSSALSSPKVINETITEKLQPYHLPMASISRREETFSKTSWPDDTPKVDDLVRAGFFYSGVQNIVTCFYCNGSLHKWGQNDKPMIEHARWFPNCTYAKHLCGENLHKKIQASKKRIQPTEHKLTIGELNQLVSARLDLPIVKRLQSQYPMNIIKRCLEDQFKIKNDDFTSDIDFTMACLILKKQIDHIKGCKDNILIPSKTTPSAHSCTKPTQSLGECVICLTEEKQLACMPCGHLCACVPCGYSLRTCPICRQSIDSFIRINS